MSYVLSSHKHLSVRNVKKRRTRSDNKIQTACLFNRINRINISDMLSRLTEVKRAARHFESAEKVAWFFYTRLDLALILFISWKYRLDHQIVSYFRREVRDHDLLILEALILSILRCFLLILNDYCRSYEFYM